MKLVVYAHLVSIDYQPTMDSLTHFLLKESAFKSYPYCKESENAIMAALEVIKTFFISR